MAIVMRNWKRPMRGYRVGGVYAVDHVLNLPLQIGNGEFTLVASIADLSDR